MRKDLARLVRYPSVLSLSKGSCLTLGNFDGLHKGHSFIVNRVVLRAEELSLTPVVVSFYPHPQKVIESSLPPPPLLSRFEQLRLLKGWGVYALYLCRFSAGLYRLKAEEFLEDVLIKKLNVKHLIMGEDSAFGYKRGGTPEAAEKLCRQKGVSFEKVSLLIKGSGMKYSSTQVRNLLREGMVEMVEKELGRLYTVRGRVVKGAGRGKKLGYPTANIFTKQFLPKNGIYACYIELNGGRKLRGAASLGFRPTYADTKEPLLEVYIIDSPYSNLYGRKVNCTFVKRIRDEIRFSSEDVLKDQIAQDVKETISLLK